MLPTAQADKLIFATPPLGFLALCKDVFPDAALSLAILPLSDLKPLQPAIQNTWLGDNELTQLKKFSLEKRSREWLGGRICAKQSANIFCLDTERPTTCPKHSHYLVESEESGRPFFSPAKSLDLNLPELSISHSKAYAAAMSSVRYCGIDIQYCAKTLGRVQEKFCTSLEEHILQNIHPELSSLTRLTQLWSAKEAAKKMLSPGGIPGFHELELIKVTKCNNSNNLLFFSRPGSTSSLQVVTGMFNKEYALAICCTTSENEVY